LFSAPQLTRDPLGSGYILVMRIQLSQFRVASAVFALACMGCGAGWSRRPLNSLGPISARQQVQVWHSGRADILHKVRVDSTQLAGIPFHKPLTCDSCYVVIPRAQIDSVRVGELVDGLWRSTALALGVLFTVGIVYCARRDCGGT